MTRRQTTRIILALLLFWGVLLSLVTLVLALFVLDGTHNTGGWSSWSRSNQAALLVWRVPLYGATVYGWYRMRLRLSQRGIPHDQNRRLIYAEAAAIVLIGLIELLTFHQN
ncbi:hypothetical protein [Pseudomonas koreensis]|uniref:Uncharacterized protein n=1 Tax=Pseudomonas koreensis TaxID=198620 RepID=A0A9X2XF26_9PSED|nr:hypothetical protein [Pseudomonas koreensis]MCU7247302.1 hypothetical protein [Pseudomonas koreensis]